MRVSSVRGGVPIARLMSAVRPTIERRRPRLLLVEDEEAVGNLVREVLEGEGYDVVLARHPREALELAAASPPFELLVTDLVMPEMNGRQLAEALRHRQPKLRVLFMSGYSASAVIERGFLDLDGRFLKKPFRAADLVAAVARSPASRAPPPSRSPLASSRRGHPVAGTRRTNAARRVPPSEEVRPHDQTESDPCSPVREPVRRCARRRNAGRGGAARIPSTTGRKQWRQLYETTGLTLEPGGPDLPARRGDAVLGLDRAEDLHRLGVGDRRPGGRADGPVRAGHPDREPALGLGRGVLRDGDGVPRATCAIPDSSPPMAATPSGPAGWTSSTRRAQGFRSTDASGSAGGRPAAASASRPGRTRPISTEASGSGARAASTTRRP